MSEENKGDSVTPESNDSVETQETANNNPSLEELESQIEALRSKNSQLLGEKKKFQSRLSELESEKQNKETEQLKEQGRYKEMYEKTATELDEIKGSLTSASKQAAFREEAMKAGVKPELVEVLEKTADLSDVSVEGFKADREQIKHEVDKLKEKYGPYFFGKQKPSVNDGTPKSEKPEETDVVSQAKKAKSQREFDEIMKKHGII